MSEKITVVKCVPGQEAVIEEIEHSLKSLQAITECDTIQAVYPYMDPIAIVCNV